VADDAGTSYNAFVHPTTTMQEVGFAGAGVKAMVLAPTIM
jgi:hypothetical protein